MPTLYDPIVIGKKQAKNRLVIPPMLTTTQEIDGFATPYHIDYYGKRAADGVGMVIVECTAICKDMRNSLGELGLYKDEHIEPMRAIAKAIKAHGALALVQLHHSGRVTPAEVNLSPLGPSRMQTADGRTVDAMTNQQILSCIDDFAAAARRAGEAGFDGVELHGCHGYLLNQFISPVANIRKDTWGGESLEDRLTFPRAVIDAVRAALSEDSILGYRMGFNDPDEVMGKAIARFLQAKGVDYLHVSGGIGPYLMPTAQDDFHGFTVAASQVKSMVDIPVIAVNSIHTLAQAERVVSSGMADLAAVGRPYLLNDDWFTAQQQNKAIVTCLQCPRGCGYLAGKCPRIHKKPS